MKRRGFFSTLRKGATHFALGSAVAASDYVFDRQALLDKLNADPKNFDANIHKHNRDIKNAQATCLIMTGGLATALGIHEDYSQAKKVNDALPPKPQSDLAGSVLGNNIETSQIPPKTLRREFFGVAAVNVGLMYLGVQAIKYNTMARAKRAIELKRLDLQYGDASKTTPHNDGFDI